MTCQNKADLAIQTKPISLIAACYLYSPLTHHRYPLAEHYADDLEVDLEEIMGADFNADLEDESPREVSRELVALHNDLIRGDTTRLARLQQLIAEFQGASMSKRQRVGVCFV